MVFSILHSLTALADDQSSRLEIPPGAFAVARADARLEVREIGLPRPEEIDPKYRICRVSVGFQQGRWAPTIREGCHPNLVDLVTEASSRWAIEVSAPPARDRELFEYWYVFPERRGDPVRVFVRQAWDQQLVLKADGLDVLDWSIKGRIFPTYPIQATEVEDLRSSECTAKVDIAPSGVPGEIAIEGCDEVFHAPLRDDLQSWRFGGPELDGVPFSSGVTFGARFTRSVDGGEAPGRVEMRFPPDPDLGERSRARSEVPLPVEPEPPPMPTWPALFVVDHRSYAEVGVYDMLWPAPPALDEERTCDVLFQVNSARRVLAWPEACDERVRPAVEEAAGRWILVHGEIGENERFARFRGTFVFPAGGGHPILRIPADDLVSAPQRLPEHVETYQVAKTIRSVPPKLPKAFGTEILEEVRCEYDVRVDRRGRPAEVTSRSCPGGYGPYAERAIHQWRWTPAAANGKPIDSQVTVRVRFELPPISGGGASG